MKILSADQVKKADAYTIAHEPISSIDLMERAGRRILDLIILDFDQQESFVVFCGPGNNGGDGLVIARLLKAAKKKVEVIVLKGNYTEEFNTNYERLNKLKIANAVIDKDSQINQLEFEKDAVIVDALFGIGISKPLEGLAAKLVQKINSFHNVRIAIDVPSGLSPDLMFESNTGNTVKADITYTVQLPKMAFMFAENNEFVGKFKCVDIGLSTEFINSEDTPHVFLDENIVRSIIKPRNKFGHKGNYGHAMMIAGSAGKTGASILASKAALRTGCGLLTALIPEKAIQPMSCVVPEAMVIKRIDDRDRLEFGEYKAIGFGPGMGTSVDTSELLYELLNLYHSSLVIDADGLNSLAYNPTWYRMLKANIIMTPHPGEFDRLTHTHKTCYERYLAQQHFSKKHQVTIVLKGHYTSITTPSGLSFFNSTGNNGMATAGSGDVLTGIITSLCAQGYEPEDAAVLGVYLHGYAGDIAADLRSKTALIASDIIDGIGKFFREFES